MNRIEEQARYYQNLPLRDRSVKAVVHLEDAEDELFWNHQLQKASPAAYHFLAYSKNDKGNEVHDCEQCLRYKSFLTSRFFICIDSDLRQLRGEKGHQLYKLVLHIGTLFCHGANVAFKTDILDKALHTEGYAEIDNVQSDLVKTT